MNSSFKGVSLLFVSFLFSACSSLLEKDCSHAELSCSVEGEVCRWTGTCGPKEIKLMADDGEKNDWSGVSVSGSGDVAIVGACMENADGKNNTGAAYIY
jgi:hypothetical protein